MLKHEKQDRKCSETPQNRSNTVAPPLAGLSQLEQPSILSDGDK